MAIFTGHSIASALKEDLSKFCEAKKEVKSLLICPKVAKGLSCKDLDRGGLCRHSEPHERTEYCTDHDICGTCLPFKEFPEKLKETKRRLCLRK